MTHHTHALGIDLGPLPERPTQPPEEEAIDQDALDALHESAEEWRRARLRDYAQWEKER